MVHQIDSTGLAEVSYREPPDKPPCQVTRQFQESNRIVVEAAVMRIFNIHRSEIRSPSRGPAQVAFARQIAMYLTHICYGLTFTAVGRLFHRDRTTVAHACVVVEDMRDDPDFDYLLSTLETTIRSMFGVEQQR
ncbi:MAG: helix-turn-helix domain-containing protein [Methyloligellaceae bacterium]